MTILTSIYKIKYHLNFLSLHSWIIFEEDNNICKIGDHKIESEEMYRDVWKIKKEYGLIEMNNTT